MSYIWQLENADLFYSSVYNAPSSLIPTNVSCNVSTDTGEDAFGLPSIDSLCVTRGTRPPIFSFGFLDTHAVYVSSVFYCDLPPGKEVNVPIGHALIPRPGKRIHFIGIPSNPSLVVKQTVTSNFSKTETFVKVFNGGDDPVLIVPNMELSHFVFVDDIPLFPRSLV